MINLGCVPELDREIEEALKENIVVNGNPLDEEPSEVRIARIRQLLNDGKYTELSRYIIRLDSCNIERRSAMSLVEQKMYFIVLVNSYLFDDFVSVSDLFEIFSKISSTNMISIIILRCM